MKQTNADGVSGRYQLYMNDAAPDGSLVPGTARLVGGLSPNLLTDSGMLALASPGAMSFCRVGAGTAAPSFTDTALASQVAVSSMGQRAAGPSGSDYSSALVTCVFAQGSAAGVLSEIGMSATATGPLSSRALILDGGGEPTTIVVDPIGILTVVYEFRLYVSSLDSNGVVSVEGVDRAVVTRSGGTSSAESAMQYGIPRGNSVFTTLTAYTGPLGPSGGIAQGSVLGSTSASSQPVYGTPTLVGGVAKGTTTHKFLATQAVGTIVAVGTPQVVPVRLKASFDPPVVKDNTKEFEVTFTRTWERR